MPAFSSEGKVSILELMPRGFQRPADNPNAQASQPVPQPPSSPSSDPSSLLQEPALDMPAHPDGLTQALEQAMAEAILADVATGVVWLRGECAVLSPEDKQVVLKIIMHAIKRAHDDKLQRYADEFAMQQDNGGCANEVGSAVLPPMQAPSGTGSLVVPSVLGAREEEE